jgi:cobalt/nickel transport system ATP-binding protein
MNNALVQLDQVRFGYTADAPVLTECDFALRPGERVAVIGANGSGKTTLLHLIVGLIVPQAGQVIAFGRPRRSEADFFEVRCRAGLLFQDVDDQLFCPTVAEDVAFGPMNLGKSRDEVRTLVRQTLEQLGLTGYEDRITHHLSGGEKRLVALAGVLAMQPDVLLLDEPTAGLDEAATDRLASILADLPQAMAIASHDRPFLDRVARSAMLLTGGRLEEAWRSERPGD